MNATTDTPVAYVISKLPNPAHPGAHLLVVECPACGRPHTHGAPEGDTGPDYGHRAAHCLGGSHVAPRGYYVRDRVAP